MKRFLKIFFILSGVVLWLEVAAVVYFFTGAGVPESVRSVVPDAIEERTIGTKEEAAPAEEQNSASSESASVPVSSEQAAALEMLGLDPSAVGSVTPEQEACFVRTLGAERVAEIKAGGVPGMTDMVKARECL